MYYGTKGDLHIKLFFFTACGTMSTSSEALLVLLMIRADLDSAASTLEADGLFGANHCYDC